MFRDLMEQVRTFNLTKLECKYVKPVDPERPAQTFNLTKLECKYIRALEIDQIKRGLLISPSWNVNLV